MKIENINEVLQLAQEFRLLQAFNRRLHDEGIISVQINGQDVEISEELRKRVRKDLIEEVRVKREEIRKKLETL